jgi:hemerythrin superfamily protein
MAPTRRAKSASATKSTKGSRSASQSDNDAIEQLTEDHARVKKMFKQYEKLAKDEADEDERQELAVMICAELTAHSTAEEEIFYPAARDALGEDADLIDEAEVEHATAKELIEQIKGSSPDDPQFDAKVKVLGEYINHHVEEEEKKIFPKVRKAKLDTAMLGEQIATRKGEVMEESGVQLAH